MRHGCIQAVALFILYMPRREPIYENYLLKHGRESCGLSIKQIFLRTGIAVKEYKLMERGLTHVLTSEAKLLGALFNINPGYIKKYGRQLRYMNIAHNIRKIKDKEIASLTKALKRKIIRHNSNKKQTQPHPIASKKIQTRK